MADDKPIIIIKKKGGHGGHHGGAWKVAYADFVTAMMAFFMVMWLLNTASETQRQNIASYFRKPGIFTDGSGTPLMIGEAGILSDGYVPPHPETEKQLYAGKSKEQLQGKSGTDTDSTGEKRVTYKGLDGKRDSVPDDDVAQRGFQSNLADDSELAVNLSRERNGTLGEGVGLIAEKRKEEISEAAKQLKEEIESAPEVKALLGSVEVKEESDGLLIEIMDTERTSMFQSGSARILPEAEAAFAKITPVLNRYPYRLNVIGHTDASGFSGRRGGYSNWELSADRANAARRFLEKSGIDPERFANVTGRASRDLKFPELPNAPGNRRITLKLLFEGKELPTDKLPPEVLQGRPSPTQGLFDDLPDNAQTNNGAAQGTTDSPTDATGNKQNQSDEIEVRRRPQAPTPLPTITADEITNPIKRGRRERIQLPETPPPTENPPPARGPGNRIFNDAPVFGPRDPFANLDTP